MTVKAEVLLAGSWYALEQSGFLLRDAAVLYRAGSYASATALAMIGREELGKSRMLLDQWNKVDPVSKSPSVESIRALCEDHIEKQRHAFVGWTFRFEGGTAISKAIETMTKRHPQDREYQEADRVIQAACKRYARHASDARHRLRLYALYVDLNDSGTDWNRPSQISQDEARDRLNEAMNDYSRQRDKLDPGLLRAAGNAKLAETLEAWSERPNLPQPVWVEAF